MQWHPYAKLFPMMTDAEIQNLADDIRENGLRHPIVVDPKDRIIDGRNRAAACELAQVKPATKVFDGSDREILNIVVSENIHRRHLDERQRAMIAAEIANLKDGQRKSTSANRPSSEPIVTQSEAAELLNTSERSLKRAKVVKEKGIPEVQAAVVNEGLPLSRAETISRLPKEEQPAALKIVREDAPRESKPQKKSREGVGVDRANEAINVLMRIPKNDPLRARAFEVVKKWIRQQERQMEASA